MRSARVRAAALAVFAIVLFTGPGAALPQASDEQLARAREALEPFAEALGRAGEARKGLESARERLESFGRLLAEAPPQPLEPFEELPVGDAESLLAEVDRRKEFFQGVEERARALSEGPGVLERAERASERWPEIERVLRQAAASAREALIALAESRARDEDEEIDLGVEPNSIEVWLARCNEIPALEAPPAALPEQVRSAASALRGILGEARPLPEELFEVARREALACEVVEGMARSVSVSIEHIRDAEPAQVHVAIDAAIAEYRGAHSSLLETLKGLEDARSKLGAATSAAAALVPPRREDYPGEGDDQELREAHGRLLHAEALVGFREESVARAEDVRAATEILAADLKASSGVFERHGEATLGLVAHRRVALDLAAEGKIEDFEMPEEVSIERIWPEFLAFMIDEARRLEENESYELWLENEDPVAGARSALEDQREQAQLAREAWGEERELVGLYREVRAWSDEDLLAALAPGGAIVSEAADTEQAREQAQTRYEERRAQARRPRSNIEDLTHPYSAIEVSRHPGRTETIRASLEDLAAGASDDPPKDRSLGPEREKDIHAEVVAGGLSLQGVYKQLGPSPEEIERLDEEQQMARDRLRYFDELGDLVGALESDLAGLVSAAEEALAAMGARSQALRRALVCAREIRARAASGRLQETQLPALDRWEDGTAPNVVRTRIDEFRSSFHLERDQLEARLEDARTLLGWRVWAELGGRVAQDKIELISLPVKHIEAANLSIDKLKDYERQNLEFEAGLLRIEMTPTLDRGLAAIAPEKTRTRFEKPLEAYFLEVANLDRNRNELEAAGKAYEKLVEVTARHRDDLAGAMESLKRSEEILWRRYQVVRHLAAATLQPKRRSAVAASFRELCAAPLPSGAGLPVEADSLAWANVLVGAEGALWGGRHWIATLEQRMSRLGFDAELNRYRTHLTRIEAEREEREESARVIGGRIDELQEVYSGALRNQAGFTLARVLLIPLLALLLARMVRRFILRVQSRSAVGGDDQEERKRRIHTLSNVAITAITAVIWVIAGIYVLAGVGLDVTPIVASASVAGLALAFGAQALVRDYFAGFCILTENQYTVGDVVDLGSASGTVEHITLRVTVLRDLEGGVHYVPNGLIQRVKNKTKGWSRVVLEVGVAYGEDLDRVTAILKEILAEMKDASPWQSMILEDPFVAGIQLLGESSISIRVMVKTQPGQQWEVARELRRRIRVRFDREGIRAPFPQRVVYQVEGKDGP